MKKNRKRWRHRTNALKFRPWGEVILSLTRWICVWILRVPGGQVASLRIDLFRKDGYGLRKIEWWMCRPLLFLPIVSPPCVFASQGMAAWVPTIEYSVNVRQLPVPGWLKAIFTTRFISSGLVEEDGELWDEENNLIAISRQIAKYHLPLN